MKCLCAATRRIARLLTQRYEEALRPANLTPAQFELMSTLAARPGLSQTKLAQALALDQTTLSRNLNLLLARAWIQRHSSPTDRRQATYALTPSGQEALSIALPLWQAAHDQMHHHLGPAWSTTWSALDLLNEIVSP